MIARLENQDVTAAMEQAAANVRVAQANLEQGYADPTLIVADEPTGDLDRVSAEEILHLLNRLNLELGKTIIMVTHDVRASDKAHTIMHLEKGVLSEREEVTRG